MAYYLMVEKKKGQYTPLDITKTSCFTRTSNLKKAGCTLEEIDIFTMHFSNEHELRRFLFKNGLVEMKDAGKSLSVRNLRNNRYYKVMYDMLYQKDIEYIMNPVKLINRVNDKLHAGDYLFIEKFANSFLNFHDCLSTAPEVREYANFSIRNNNNGCPYFFYLDENGDNPLIRMTKLLIYDYYQEQNGKTHYKSTIKYRNLHAVLAFTNNYDKAYINQLNNQNNNSLSTSKTKKRVKNEVIPGQTSFFE